MSGEENQIYFAVAGMDVYARAWAGGGQLGVISADGEPMPLVGAGGVNEVRLGSGSDVKETTVDFDAAFRRTNPLSDTAFLTLVLFQRKQGQPQGPEFNRQQLGPLPAPFGDQPSTTLQTSVSII
jgi:hypothetical protein